MCADDSHDQLIANMTEFVQQYLRDTPVISTDVPSVALLDVASDEPTPSTSMTATYTSQWETEIQLFFIFYYEQEAKLSLGYPTVLPHSTFEGHVTSSVTWPFNSPCTISDWWSFGTESLSPAVFEILCSKCIRVTSLTFLDNVTSSVTWSFDSPYTISYWWSFGTKPLSLTVSEIFNVECHAMVDMTLIRALKKGQGHSFWYHSISHIRLPIGSQ